MRDQQLLELQEKIGYEHTFSCVQCGYCLPACPTYESMEKETHSPRGRINLVKMAAEGKIDLEDIRDPIDKCLGCQACVTACPTDTQYGRILEGAKAVLAENEKKSFAKKTTEKVLFQNIFPSSKKMGRMGNLLWGYQKSGLQTVARKTGLTKLSPLNLGEFEKIAPEVPSPKERKSRPTEFFPDGDIKANVAIFTGCIMDTAFFTTNQRTIDLLTYAGAKVTITDNQTCCGALHAHSGDIKTAKKLAKQNIEAFENENIDYIVHNAGGCGAQLVEYTHFFDDEPEWKERAEKFVAAAKDITEVLIDLRLHEKMEGIEATKEEVVTYQPSCHMTHVQKVTDEPLTLLKSIPGVTYKEMEASERCCGSAGIYNIVNYDESMDILDLKMKRYKPTKATTIVTTNPGCLLQMKMGVKREGLDQSVRVVHLVDLLHESLIPQNS